MGAMVSCAGRNTPHITLISHQRFIGRIATTLFLYGGAVVETLILRINAAATKSLIISFQPLSAVWKCGSIATRYRKHIQSVHPHRSPAGHNMAAK